MTTVDTSSKSSNIKSLLSKYAIVWVTILVFIFLSASTDAFLSIDNLRNILDQQSVVLIVAAFTTIVLISGGFDVSLGAIYILAPLVALRVQNNINSAWLTLLAGVLVGLITGLLNGIIVAYGKINSFIATLATSFIFFGIAYLVSDGTILRVTDINMRKVATTHILGLTSATWIAFLVIAIAWILLDRTRFGRYIFSVGGNFEAARLAGVRTNRVVVAAFVLAGAGAGLAGTLNSIRSVTAQASDDFSIIFSVIAAVVVGGTSIAGGSGAIWRSVVGVFFIAFIVNGFNLNGVDPVYQRIIQGAVILTAVGADAWSRRDKS
ncbi:MAG: ABC transporter permease [Actinobacteria bacterium]|jgi:ribose transport system permease protein|nr:ABC transporter permease [Actinomycetota bacterium]NBP91581.1 ABC transporter permease [Actinomycetota bacterium]